jgi:hypothetical protein
MAAIFDTALLASSDPPVTAQSAIKVAIGSAIVVITCLVALNTRIRNQQTIVVMFFFNIPPPT